MYCYLYCYLYALSSFAGQKFIRWNKGQVRRVEFYGRTRKCLVKLDRFSLHLGMQLLCRCTAMCRKFASVRAAVQCRLNLMITVTVVSTRPTKPKSCKILRSPANKRRFGYLGGLRGQFDRPKQQYCHRVLGSVYPAPGIFNWPSTMTILRLLLTKKVEHSWQNRIAQRFTCTTTSGNTHKHILPDTNEATALRWRSRSSR